MKTRIMIKNVSSGLVFMFLMLISATGYSQACTGNKVAVRVGIVGTGNVTGDGTLGTTLGTVYSYVDYDLLLTNIGTTGLKIRAIQETLGTQPALQVLSCSVSLSQLLPETFQGFSLVLQLT